MIYWDFKLLLQKAKETFLNDVGAPIPKKELSSKKLLDLIHKIESVEKKVKQLAYKVEGGE